MWRTPEELVTIGSAQSRIVMMNEFHNGNLRCIRTRVIGRRILSTIYNAGVGYLAMEALHPLFTEEANRTRIVPGVEQGYLAHPEMRDLIQTALDLGLTLISYEADINKVPRELAQEGLMSAEVTNWREEVQARNINNALQILPLTARILVWCGNGHHTKEVFHAKWVVRDGKRFTKPEDEPDWTPMGYLFKQMSDLDPFTIHQEVLVAPHLPENLLDYCQNDIEIFGGTAGFLKGELPHPSLSHFVSHSGDAFVFSTDNAME